MSVEYVCGIHSDQSLFVRQVHDEALTGFYCYVQPCPTCLKEASKPEVKP